MAAIRNPKGFHWKASQKCPFEIATTARVLPHDGQGNVVALFIKQKPTLEWPGCFNEKPIQAYPATHNAKSKI